MDAARRWLDGLPRAFGALLGGRGAGVRRALDAGDARSAAALLDEANALPGDPAALEPAGSGPASPDPGRASRLLGGGELAVELFAAGAATRLNDALAAAGRPRVALYFADPWGLAEALGGAAPADALRLPLGPRQLSRLRLRALELGGEGALRRLSLLLHVTDELLPAVEGDLLRNGFYGLDPARVWLAVQPALPGFEALPDGSVRLDPGSPRFPYNHGHATLQLGWAGQSHRLGPDGARRPEPRPPLEALLEAGARLAVTHRVNDLDRLGERVLDLGMLSAALAAFDGGDATTAVELVDNPGGQMGGLGLRRKGEGPFLLETLNARTPALAARLAELSRGGGLPYNAFRLVHRLSALGSLLADGLPLSLRLRGARLYPEIPTGDLTRGRAARAVMLREPGRLIADFKTTDDLQASLSRVRAQDSDPSFRKLASEWKAG